MINSIVDGVMTFSISKVQDNHMYKNVQENKIKKEKKGHNYRFELPHTATIIQNPLL